MKHAPILQLEDDENDVMFLQFAFKAAQVPNPLITVRDGQEAIDYLSGAGTYGDRSRHPIPIMAILDLKTPGLTGHDVLRWIRGSREYRTLITVILSASANQSDVDTAYEAGANAFLMKPAGLDRLTEMVRSMHAFWLKQNQFPTPWRQDHRAAKQQRNVNPPTSIG